MPPCLPVSVILSTLNEGLRLRETLESLAAASTWPTEVLVVDDGSTDQSLGTLSNLAVPFELLCYRRPHEGIAPARGFGARHASQPVWVFLDAHCAVEANWLGELLRPLEEDPRAIVVPVIANRRRRKERGCGARLVNDLLAYQWITADPVPDEVGIAPGGCFAIGRDTYVDLGGFAPMRGFGVEDVELSLRAWRMGHTIRTAPGALIDHEFRTQAPYPMNHQSWLTNVLETALVHLDSARLQRTLEAAAGFGTFAPAITTALVSDWLERKQWIEARAVRPLSDYWLRFCEDTKATP
jgi:GT2 family glycosyltransferase